MRWVSFAEQSRVISRECRSDEQTLRCNNRNDMGDGDRFILALSQITGKRLIYEHLTGKDIQPSPSPLN